MRCHIVFLVRLWLVSVCLISPVLAQDRPEEPGLLSGPLRHHAAAMLLVEPENGAILDANEAAARLYGYPLSQLRRMNIAQINVLGASEIALERHNALSQARNYFIFPHRFADGRLHTMEVYSSPVELPGNRKALLSVVLDMSGKQVGEGGLLAYKNRLEELVVRRTRELDATHSRTRQALQGTIIFQAVIILLLLVTLFYRRQIQKTLEKQKRMMESMLDSSLQFMGMLDVEGRLLHINRTAQDRFAVKDARGGPLKFWESAWWSHSEADREQLKRAILLAAMGEASRFESRHPLPDGQVLDFDFSIRPILDGKGKVAGLLAEGRDITARKQAEQQLQSRRKELQDANNYLKTLVGALPDTLMELDANGRIYQYRTPLPDFPAPAQDGSAGWTIQDILPAAAAAAILSAVQEAAAAGASRGQSFVLAESRRFDVSVSRLPDSEGLPARFVVLARENAVNMTVRSLS
jgi:PAS domain S-box-containing protein